jgi:hypothetical protein
MNITRRKFLQLSAVSVAASASFPLRLQSSEPFAGSPKKGLGLAPRNPVWPQILTDLRCKWVYTWVGRIPPNLPEEIKFFPMVRRTSSQPEQIARIGEEAKAHGITQLLGFNEPDAERQDNMTVEEVLAVWPLLMETGLRLGSPGCVHPDREWMQEFMAGVEERGLRVDFINVHSYGGPDPGALINRLRRVYEMFGRPLWITELGVGDWKAQTVEENEHSPEVVWQFLHELLPQLDGLDFLEYYAWFPSSQDNPALGTSALFDSEGQLTPLGELYRDA